MIFRNRAGALPNRSTDAAETFTKAASPLNRPFVTEQVKTGNWLFSKTKTIEGSTISGILHSGIQQANGASTTKKVVAGATLLAVTAVVAYFLRSQSFGEFEPHLPGGDYFINELDSLNRDLIVIRYSNLNFSEQYRKVDKGIAEARDLLKQAWNSDLIIIPNYLTSML